MKGITDRESKRTRSSQVWPQTTVLIKTAEETAGPSRSQPVQKRHIKTGFGGGGQLSCSSELPAPLRPGSGPAPTHKIGIYESQCSHAWTLKRDISRDRRHFPEKDHSTRKGGRWTDSPRHCQTLQIHHRVSLPHYTRQRISLVMLPNPTPHLMIATAQPLMYASSQTAPASSPCFGPELSHPLPSPRAIPQAPKF